MIVLFSLFGLSKYLLCKDHVYPYYFSTNGQKKKKDFSSQKKRKPQDFENNPFFPRLGVEKSLHPIRDWSHLT